ncbi:hypothetical protein Zmor_021488 [Zophobas morio]|uniref:Uncharacterized protein n=1 Tax=Zophobas morio TaxID=2755281 RepID=A0AA38I648_9CUCU|nr:hypothetical protein Zmor_021488 [Zophobas morio]
MVAEKRNFDCVAEVDIVSDSDDECAIVHINPRPSKIRVLENVLLGSGASTSTSTSTSTTTSTSTAAGLDISILIENFIESVRGTKASETIDTVVKELVVEKPSHLEAEDEEEEEEEEAKNQDELFNSAFESYEKDSAVEERKRQEKRHIPRERRQLLCPKTFQLTPSDGSGSSSVTVGFKMPTGEVVCRLCSGTSVVFVDFTLTEFVEFSNKMNRKVAELDHQVLVRRKLCVLKNYNVMLCRNKIVMFEPIFLTTSGHSLFIPAHAINKILCVRLFVINILRQQNQLKTCWPDYDAFVVDVAQHIRANKDDDFDVAVLNVISEKYRCNSILFEIRCKLYFSLRNHVYNILDKWAD